MRVEVPKENCIIDGVMCLFLSGYGCQVARFEKGVIDEGNFRFLQDKENRAPRVHPDGLKCINEVRSGMKVNGIMVLPK